MDNINVSAVEGKLSLERLKSLPAGKVFAAGEVENSPEGVYMTDNRKGDTLVWVAKRGTIHDWAIYVHWKEKGLNYAMEHGQKVTSKENILKLVPCEDDAIAMYRY